MPAQRTTRSSLAPGAAERKQDFLSKGRPGLSFELRWPDRFWELWTLQEGKRPRLHPRLYRSPSFAFLCLKHLLVAPISSVPPYPAQSRSGSGPKCANTSPQQPSHPQLPHPATRPASWRATPGTSQRVATEPLALPAASLTRGRRSRKQSNVERNLYLVHAA